MTSLRKIAVLLIIVSLAATACSGTSTPSAAPSPFQPSTDTDSVAVTSEQPANESASEPSGGDHCIRNVCPVFDGQQIRGLHKQAVWSLTLLGDNTIASGDDMTVRLWQIDDLASQLENSVVIDNPSFGRTVIDIGNGQVAVTGDSVVIADLATQDILHTLQGSNQLALVGNDKLVTGTTESNLFLYDLGDLSAPIAQVDGEARHVSSIDGLIYFRRQNSVFVWDGVTEPTEVIRIQGLWRFLVTPDHLLLGDKDGVITVVNRLTGEPITTLVGMAEFGVSAIVQLANGTIAAGGSTGDIFVWDLARPDEPMRLAALDRYVTALLALPDGTLLASTGGEGRDTGVVALFNS